MKPNLPKKGAGRKLSARLKSLGTQQTPKNIVNRINGAALKESKMKSLMKRILYFFLAPMVLLGSAIVGLPLRAFIFIMSCCAMGCLYAECGARKLLKAARKRATRPIQFVVSLWYQ